MDLLCSIAVNLAGIPLHVLRNAKSLNRPGVSPDWRFLFLQEARAMKGW